MHRLLALVLVMLLPAVAQAEYRIIRDDRGIWMSAVGDTFPDPVKDPPHDGAIFYYLPQRLHYIYSTTTNAWSTQPLHSAPTLPAIGTSLYGGTEPNAVQYGGIHGSTLASSALTTQWYVGLYVYLTGGPTLGSSSQSRGILIDNNVGTTNTTWDQGGQQSTAALLARANADVAGTVRGVTGYAENSVGRAIGVHGAAPFDSSQGIGVVAIGNGAANGIGLYTTLRPNTTDIPTDTKTSFMTAATGSWPYLVAYLLPSATPVYQINNGGDVWHRSANTTLTESSNTVFAQHNIPAGTRQGGTITYCVEADDGTAIQTRCGSVPFAASNTAGGTETCAVGTATDAVAPSSGTLTVTFGTNTGADICQYTANAASSLTQTTLRLAWHFDTSAAVGPLSGLIGF